MPDALHEAKDLARAAARARVRALALRERAQSAAAVLDTLDELLGDAGTVLVYFADADEVDLDPFITARLARGGGIAAPRCDWDAGTFTPTRVRSLADTEVRRHGVREPLAGEVIAPDDLSAVLVPGVAFDLSGRRLGRGGGFYDRALALFPNTVRRVGVCFDAQRVERVPAGAHDIAMNALVTESGLVFSDQRSG